MKKLVLILLILLVAAIIWIADLRRRLQAETLRGDMYRDISARLDRRITEQTPG